MSDQLRKQILNQLKKIIKEEVDPNQYRGGGVSFAVTSRKDPGIQRLVGGNGTPQDILNFVKSQAGSTIGYINDEEARLMKDSVVNATTKCSKPQLSSEELTWCQDYKRLAPEISKASFGWNTYTGTQGSMRMEFNKAIDNAKNLNLRTAPTSTPVPTTQTSATPAGQLPTACPNNAKPVASNPDGTQKCPDGTSITVPDLAPTTPAGTFDQRTRSFKCTQPNTVMNFQNWIKSGCPKEGQLTCQNASAKAKGIKADGAFGPLTFAAAKSLGGGVLNFDMYQTIEDFKDQAKLNKVCADLSGDARFRPVAKPATTPTTPAVTKESKMSKKLRQKILKELNYLLKEDIDRTVATTATGLGAAGVAGAGALGAGVSSAMGGSALGGAAAGIAGGVVFAPIAIGALAIGALYLAFRTAGWQEVAEDIMDASGTMRNRPELADKLPTKKYFDLTTMTDATDKSDFMSLVSAMKGIQERLSTLQNAEEYMQFVEVVKQYKPTLDLMCGVEGGISKGGFFLLNEFGLNDRLYHYKCAKVDLKIPSAETAKLISAQNQQAVSPPASQGSEELQERILREIKAILREQEVASAAAPTNTATPVAVSTSKCAKSENIFLPVEFRDIGLEDEIADAPMPIRDPSVPALPPITCPLIEAVCGGEDTPTPAPQPTPGPDEGGTGGSCVRCKSVKKGCKGASVKEIHDKLIALKLMFPINPKPGTTGVSQGSGEINAQLFGPATEEAVIQFQKSKGLKADGIVGPATCKALGITGGGGKGGKGGGGKGGKGGGGKGGKGGGGEGGGGTGGTGGGGTGGGVPQSLDWRQQFWLVNQKLTAGGLSGNDLVGAKAWVERYLRPYRKNPVTEVEINKAIQSLISEKIYTIDAAKALAPYTPPKLNEQKESKQFNHEKYYDVKKEKEANMLFEKLIRRLK